jgi:HSP20 family protein
MAVPAVRSSAGSSATPMSSGSVGRWDPVREFADLHSQFGQLVQSVFGPTGMLSGAGLDQSLGQGLTQAWRPLADVSETDDHYLVEVDVPGVNRDDITIEVTGNELSIRGEFKEKERTGLLRSRTRRVGQFEFRTLLPREVDAERITAELGDGVLTVTVPKTEAVKPRRVEITAR